VSQPNGPLRAIPSSELVAIAPQLVHANRSVPELIELALEGGEGQLAANGALMALTGKRTGRSPQDRFIVREPESEPLIDWGAINQPMEPAGFDRLCDAVRHYLQGRELFLTDAQVCADPAYRLRVRVVAELAWHALFARCLFLRPTADELASFEPDWHIIVAPRLHLHAKRDGVHSDAAVAISFARRTVLIIGTHYAGEIKKSVFSVLNFLLPSRGVFPMHCSATIGPDGDTALYFGLSGTGKTTLSADPTRRLIGDDEHGWSEAGIFNIEGGCYAKTIRLSPRTEPQIYAAIRFGSVLENVPLDPHTREPDYDSCQYTENTRAAYPVTFIPGCELKGTGGHPQTIFFLTCDAFGVLPPISRLTPQQAREHFLLGYTAKVAGTEVGVSSTPQATFSTCFGAPFMPLRPSRYADLLVERLNQHKPTVWLVNTGWTGGPAGVGQRMPLPATRALLRAALSGQLAQIPTRPDPIFGLNVPVECPGVPTELLSARSTWSNPDEYDREARKLAEQFAQRIGR
jgi:phosphoenolpyruvate carboxykinase (ATP)